MVVVTLASADARACAGCRIARRWGVADVLPSEGPHRLSLRSLSGPRSARTARLPSEGPHRLSLRSLSGPRSARTARLPPGGPHRLSLRSLSGPRSARTARLPSEGPHRLSLRSLSGPLSCGPDSPSSHSFVRSMRPLRTSGVLAGGPQSAGEAIREGRHLRAGNLEGRRRLAVGGAA